MIDSDPTGQGRPGGFLHSYEPQLVDFAQSIRDGKPLTASAEYAVGEVAVIQAMYRSGEKSAWEDVWCAAVLCCAALCYLVAAYRAVRATLTYEPRPVCLPAGRTLMVQICSTCSAPACCVLLEAFCM